jgi:hypothetical protein
VIVAGSVCSGVRGLGAQSLGGDVAQTQGAEPGLIAILSEPSKTGAAVELAVMELSTRRLRWKKSIQASARPQILRDVVVTASGESLVAYDLATGTERFRSLLGRPLWLGAAQSGKTLVVTTGTASWDPRQRGSTLLALDAESGDVRWRRDVPFALSAPVIRAERALVVADHADLWTLDLASGSDTGCGPLGGNTVEWLEAAPGGLMFGAAEARLLAPDAHERGSTLELARRDLPGRPFIQASSYLPVPGARSAHGRVAAIAPLRTGEHGPALAGDMFYFVFYRDVFGFRADGSLAWAQLVDTDVVRAAADDAGLWLVTEAGLAMQLDAGTGEAKNATGLGFRVASAEIRPALAGNVPPPTAAAPLAGAAGASPGQPGDVGAVPQPSAAGVAGSASTAAAAASSVSAVPAQPTGASNASATTSPPAGAASSARSATPSAASGASNVSAAAARMGAPLEAAAPSRGGSPATNAQPDATSRLQASLRRVAEDTDARLLPARLLAVDELAALDAPSASGDLLAVYSAPNTPSGLRDRIAKRLRERTRGAEYLVAALAQHEDFIEERPAPPLRAIVPGLVTQHATHAVPGLVSQLFDPDTSVSDLEMVVSAIDALSGDEGREPLRRFFAMYRADSALAGDPTALLLSAQVLLARNDAPGRALIEAARDNAATSASLREQLAALLQPIAAAPGPVAEEVATAPVRAAAPVPIDLRTLLDAARPQLAPCVDAAQARSPKLSSVRLWFVAHPDGSVRDVHVTPIDKQLASCLGGKLAELRLPSDRKQLVSYQLTVRPPAGSESADDSIPANAEFWSQAERRAAKHARTPQTPPWWLDQNPLFVLLDETGAPRNTPAQPSVTASGAAAKASTPNAATGVAGVTPSSPAGAPAPEAAAASAPVPGRQTKPNTPASSPEATSGKPPQPAPQQPPAASGLKPAAAAPAQPEDQWWVPVEGGKH